MKISILHSLRKLLRGVKCLIDLSLAWGWGVEKRAHLRRNLEDHINVTLARLFEQAYEIDDSTNREFPLCSISKAYTTLSELLRALPSNK